MGRKCILCNIDLNGRRTKMQTICMYSYRKLSHVFSHLFLTQLRFVFINSDMFYDA